MTVRLTILVKKRDDKTIEEFNKYWSEDHCKIFFSVPITKEKPIKYQQFHVNRPIADALSSRGLPISEFDGGAEFFGETLDDIMSVFKDPEYVRVVIPDEESFIKRFEAKMMVGWEEVKWEKPRF